MAIAELNGIIKDYYHPVTGLPTRVLNHISLLIPETETLAITGPSGSGKTTLLNILGTLDQPTSGKVLLDGMDTGTLDEVAIARLRNRFIGFVFQQHMLLPQLNLVENVLLPTMTIKEKKSQKEVKERALALLEKAGLIDHVLHYPAHLSVGECQRVAVVRALINCPKLLLADEPTGSLDADNAAKITDLLVGLHDIYGYALVVVTHDPDVANRMNRHYRLAHSCLNSNQ
jgi:lipoprotein-releasing system ATP-binding protein